MTAAADVARRATGFESLSSVLSLSPFATVAPPSTSRSERIAPVIATPAERIRALEHELTALLSTSTPATWRESRAQLWRVFRRARRELRS